MHARRVVAFQDTNKKGGTAYGAALRDCVCQGSMFSKSAFSVGRAVDTVQSSCGASSAGILVTGASDIFTRVVENPVQMFVPFGFYNDETGAFRALHESAFDMPVQEVNPEDYFGTANDVSHSSEWDRSISEPQHLAMFNAYFIVFDRDVNPMNGQASDVQIQWIEVPESVSLLEVNDAKDYGGQQVSACPREGGGSVLPPITAALAECALGNTKCSDPGTKKTLVGPLVVCTGWSVGSLYGSVGW